MDISKLPICGDNVADDWRLIKPLLRDFLKQKKVSIEQFATHCESQLIIPAMISPDSIRHHFSDRSPSTYALVDLYLRTVKSLN